MLRPCGGRIGLRRRARSRRRTRIGVHTRGVQFEIRDVNSLRSFGHRGRRRSVRNISGTTRRSTRISSWRTTRLAIGHLRQSKLRCEKNEKQQKPEKQKQKLSRAHHGYIL